MKRFLTIAIPAIFLAYAAFGAPSPLFAAQAVFSAPVPAGSSTPNQTTGRPATQTDATVVKFFDHPLASGQRNFGVYQGTVTIDGKAYRVSDVVATPGLLPRNPVDVQKAAEMIVDIPAPTALFTPAHGICPEATYVKHGSGLKATFSYNCRLWGKSGDPPANVEPNYTDRQLEVADIRDTVPPASNDEFTNLFGGNPLEDFLIGDARETTTPYVPATYPALIDSDIPGEEAFQPGWMKKFSDAQGYNEVFAYDIAPIPSGASGNDGLLAAAVYDSLDLGVAFTMDVAAEVMSTIIGQMSVGLLTYGDYVEKMTCKPTDPKYPDCIENEDEISMPFSSPAAFFRRDFQEGRMRFAGYTSFLQVPKNMQGYTYELDESTSPPSLKPLASPIAIEAAAVGQHYNPIAVVAMKYPKGLKGLSNSIDTDGFAVVNQATMLSLDDLAFRNGNPLVINGVAQRWRDIFRVKKADGTYEMLTKERMPNRVISTAVFWNRSIDAGTGKLARWGADYEAFTLNPNFIYDPLVIGITGPGMYDAASTVEKIPNNGARNMLVIPAGEPDENGKYYVYKIDPVNGDKIWWVEAGKPLVEKETPFVAPDFYEVDVPKGFAPYQVAVAEIWDDTDGYDDSHICEDILLTFRGSVVTALESGFMNSQGENVVFGAGKDEQGKDDVRMFSPEVRAYRGVVDKYGKCWIENQDTPAFRRTFITATDAQVAAIAVANFNGVKGDDLLVGDLVPREIVSVAGQPADPQAGQVTGFATLYPEFNNGPIDVQQVRVGFAASSVKPWLKSPLDPSSEIDPQYLLDVVRNSGPGADGLLGVGALDGDRRVPTAANIAAINGAPLMLPPFGCSVPDGADVVSPYEVTMAALQKLPNPNLPQRCQELTLCVNEGNELPVLQGGPCCDPCEDPVKSTPENECTLLCWNNASNPYYNKTLCEYYFEGESAKCPPGLTVVNPCANGGCTWPEQGIGDDNDTTEWTPIDPIDRGDDGIPVIITCSEKLSQFGKPSSFTGTSCCKDACGYGCMKICAMDAWADAMHAIECAPDPSSCLPRNDEYVLDGEQANLCADSKFFASDGTNRCGLCPIEKNDCGSKGGGYNYSAVKRFRDTCMKPDGSGYVFRYDEVGSAGAVCRYWRDLCKKSSGAGWENLLLDKATKASECTSRNDTDDGGEDSAFASAWRPDEVVTAPRDGIISAAALEPATFQPGTLPDGGIGIIQIKPKAPRFPRGQMMPGPREMTVVVNTGLAVDSCYTADTVVAPYQCNDAGGCNTAAGESCNSTTCMCKPPEGSCYTAASIISPFECNSAGGCDTAAGESCNSTTCMCQTGPVGPEPVNPCYDTHGTLPVGWECNADVGCSGTQQCVQNSSGSCVCLGGGVSSNACSIDTSNPPSDPAWDCNAAVSCQTGQICALVGTDCKCVEPTITPSEVVKNDCTCTVTGDPSESFQKERQRLNSEFGAGPSGKSGYDLFVASESKISCLCYIPGAAGASTAVSSPLSSSSSAIEVLPSATIQMGGQFFKNFLQPGPFTRETVTEAIQILPGPGGEGAGKALTVDLSSSASVAGATPMASLVSTSYTAGSSSVAGGSSVDINGVLRREIFPVTAGGNFSISAGGVNVSLSAPADGAYVRYDFVTMPWCPLLPGASGYQENCFVGGAPTTDTLKAVKEELQKRKAAGVTTSDIFVGLPWPQTFNNQFKHVQVLADGNVAEPQFAFLTADFIGGRGGGCGCVLGGVPPEMPALLFIIIASAAVMGGLVLVRVRSRRK